MQSGFIAEKPLGYVRVAAGALDTAININSLTFPNQPAAGVPPGAVLLLISCEAQAIRWRDDGTAPTTAVGTPLAIGGELRYTALTKNLQLIASTAGALLNVTAYGH